MKSLIRKLLFKTLSFESYLYVLSKMYFTSFRLGFLKNNEVYSFPHFLKNIIHPQDVVIDIGANLGYLTVLFSDLVGAKGQVHSVEPVKPVLAVLRRNTKNRKNVTIYPYALGTENKTIKLGNNSEARQGYIGSGQHFVLDKEVNKNDSASTEFDAEMRRGSELFQDFTRLDFIKIDIEGFETVVVPEMESVIRKFRPGLLIESGGEKRKMLLEYLGNLGYDAFELESEKLIPAKASGRWDVLFIHKDKLGSIGQFLQ